MSPDHRLKLPKIGTVENYRHFWLLSIWIVYLIFYVIAEHAVTENYWVSYMALDDRIPFLEIFIIPYCLWHPMLAAMTVYLAFFDVDTFRKFMASVALGFLPVLVFCVLFPNGQDLRPTEFPRTNLLTGIVSLIYAADTNTNVLPSMHVIGCAILTAASFSCKKLRSRKLHLIMLPVCILICISTVFVKQHSLLDLLAAIPYSAFVLLVVYWRPKKQV